MSSTTCFTDLTNPLVDSILIIQLSYIELRTFSIIMIFRFLHTITFVFTLTSLTVAQSIVVKPYLQNASPTQITVMWEADDVGNASVWYGNTPFDLNTEISSTSIIGNGNSQIHTALIEGLSAKTKYYYRVEMEDGTQSLVYHFVTPPAPSSNENVQIVAMSDMQRDGSQPNKFKEIVEEGIMGLLAPDDIHQINELEAVMIPGDLVVTGGTYSQWQEHFFLKSDSLFSRVPFYPVMGNHEYHGTGGPANFLKYFTLPENGPTGMEERAWYQDLSNVRMIGFDSNADATDQDTQLSWLENLLNSTCTEEQIDFVFAELHHPHLSELWTPGESNFTGEIIELLEAFTTDCNKASIHFFGHTHGYSRGQSRDDQHLWVNVATAGGAIDNWGEFPNADYQEFVKSQDEYGFVLVELQAGLDPYFILKRYGRGDQDAIQDNVLRDEIIIRNNENGPKTPSNIFPIGNAIYSQCIVLQGSQFDDNEDEHQASHWQVASTTNFTNDLVAESWKQSENWYNEVDTQADDNLTNEKISGLAPGENYFWRVRYRDQYLEWSDWSAPSSFDVISADTISNNLLTNGDAENGITGWIGEIESLENAECNSINAYEGIANFAVGGVCTNESTEGTAYQEIDLTSYATEIDADQRSIYYNGYMRNFNGSDIPECYLEFYDSNDILLATTNSMTNTTDIWKNEIGIENIPVSSRFCRLVLKGTRTAGSDNDSYFDAFELYVGERSECITCIGESNVDSDGDGFCDDLDCNDDNAFTYPGALEICDLLDNNCDGRGDLGDTIRWTGMGPTNLWNVGTNWDQNFAPLPCQYVIIDDNAMVEINGSYTCKGIKIAVNNSLTIVANHTLLVNGNNTGTIANVSVDGTLINNGICEIKNATSQCLEVTGTITNEGVIKISNALDDSILIKENGIINGNGEIMIRE